MQQNVSVFIWTIIMSMIGCISTSWASQRTDWNKVGSSQQPIPYDINAFQLYHFNLKGSYLPTTTGNTDTITIPTPDGNFERFAIINTPVMAPALAAKYPNIQTYSGTSLDRKGGSIKISTDGTQLYYYIQHIGFSYFINPLGNDDYIVFYKDAAQKMARHQFDCHHVGSPEITPVDEWDNTMPNTTEFAYGTERRKYRIAIASTYEYGKAVTNNNPTKPGILAAMVTTLNRVNGVYERNLGITFELVANNDTLIYTTAADPFTNNNPDFMLTQNKTTLNARIGEANYDIGHVFSTGGGGLAMLASLCDNFYKAQGVTGTDNPVGDPFDIDFVCHEIGHQVGADHIQNKCAEENLLSAFEPGSGSTIMGYAGLCDINDIQSNSMDFFHPYSLYEMSQHIGDIPTCGTVSASSHPAPAAFILSNNAYNIPANTAFELEGPQLNDVDDYNWIQWNRGNFRQNEALGGSFTTGPSFKMLYPDMQAYRMFPQLNKVLNNTYSTLGERIPQVSRMLYFRLMTRKFDNSWGTFKLSDDSIKINVVGNSAGFLITYPNNSNQVFKANDTLTVQWDVSNSKVAPINCDAVSIALSYDGGQTFPTILAANVANSGSYTITLPDTTHENIRIKVKAQDNIFFDINNANFKIDQNISVATIEPLAVQISPIPFDSYLHIALPSPHQIVITDILGKQIFSATDADIQIATSNWASGIYMVQVYNSQQQLVSSQKVIKH